MTSRFILISFFLLPSDKTILKSWFCITHHRALRIRIFEVIRDVHCHIVSCQLGLVVGPMRIRISFKTILTVLFYLHDFLNYFCFCILCWKATAAFYGSAPDLGPGLHDGRWSPGHPPGLSLVSQS